METRKKKNSDPPSMGILAKIDPAIWLGIAKKFEIAPCEGELVENAMNDILRDFIQHKQAPPWPYKTIREEKEAAVWELEEFLKANPGANKRDIACSNLSWQAKKLLALRQNQEGVTKPMSRIEYEEKCRGYFVKKDKEV
jgi:hypothetical protein